MEYCLKCGTKLIKKELEHEGLIPYCDKCHEYRFEPFSTAVSMIIVDSNFQETLLIKQYNNDRYILVAGYITKGEAAEEALKRELMEEVGLKVKRLIFQKTKYHARTNTLMINYIVVVEDTNVIPNYEIDSYKWFSIQDGLDNIAKCSLAKEFYQLFYDRLKNNEI